MLAALWGGSFLFMRICAPSVGPTLLILLRVGLAALFLLCVARLLRRGLPLRGRLRHYAVVGVFNSAIPFSLFAVAAIDLPASLLSILNATAPIWAAIISAVLARAAPARATLAGLVLGLGGVAILVGLDGGAPALAAPGAVLAGLAGAFSYGIATSYARRAPAIEPFDNALGSMLAATVVMLPLAIADAAPQPVWDARITVSVLLLGVVSTGAAYLLYFRLIQDIGPPAALTVTFLIPLFGSLWGVLLLGESVGWHTLAGGAAVIAGTALASGRVPARLLRPSRG